MIRFDFPHKVTTKTEADALLDQLLPKLPTHRNAYTDPTSFADAVKASSRVRYALMDTFFWVHEQRPKIYKRCRTHLFLTLCTRAEDHLAYWRTVTTTAWQREKPKAPAPS